MFPEQINNRRASGVLDIVWSDGASQVLPHATLRAACKCAQCQSARLLGQSAPLDEQVRIDDIVPVGLYAIQLVFSDGHQRGIYPWTILRTLSDLKEN